MEPRSDSALLISKDRPEGGGDGRVNLRYVQGLRIVTALWILVNHFLSHDGLPQWAINLIFARPVHLFAVISGLVTHMAYARRDDIGGCLHFLCKRGSKIAFAYYATALVSFLLAEFAKSYNGAPASEHWWHLLSFVLVLFGLNTWICIALLFQPVEVTTLGLGRAFDAPYNIDNLPLWFLQALAFCWFSYPLVRKLLPGSQAPPVYNILTLIGLYGLSMLPFVAVCAVDGEVECTVPVGRVSEHFEHWNVIKYWPPFMLAPFYMGAVAWDLFLSEQERLAASPAGAGWHKYATLLGETLCVGFIIFNTLVRTPYFFLNNAWNILFAAVVFLFAVANILDGQRGLAVKAALEADVMVFCGEWALLIYTLQMPLATVFYWSTGEGVREMSPWRFMGPVGFCVFVPTLFALSFVVFEYVDRPVTKWLSKAIADATEPISDLLKF